MKVQRVRLPHRNQIRWIVLDDEFIPIQPICLYLTFLDDLDRSPNTIRATAHHLKLFWEYLRDEHLCWTEMNVVRLAAFITWLRRSDTGVISIEHKKASRTNATIDQILGAVHGFYQFHMRLGTVSELPLYQLSMPNHRQYKPFLHGIVKAKPEQRRVVSTKRERRLPKTLTIEQVETLIDACTHTRDKFLLTLLFQSGMRIGQVLGLKHADLSVEDGSLQIVPRSDNPNGARAKTRNPYVIPALPEVMQLYTDYLIEDLGALEVDSLPDFVFVNLWEGDIGRPMTYEAVMSLVKRLTTRTGINFTPHMLRHTRATLWIRSKQVSLEEASRLLGHASVQTTHDTYVHLTAEDLRAALTKEGGHDVS
ncbi:MAG TPA: tyrosine-type recombinase/integrase [Ktedonobacteraceae bacterium]